jgi:hypothetical protein
MAGLVGGSVGICVLRADAPFPGFDECDVAGALRSVSCRRSCVWTSLVAVDALITCGPPDGSPSAPWASVINRRERSGPRPYILPETLKVADAAASVEHLWVALLFVRGRRRGRIDDRGSPASSSCSALDSGASSLGEGRRSHPQPIFLISREALIGFSAPCRRTPMKRNANVHPPTESSRARLETGPCRHSALRVCSGTRKPAMLGLVMERVWERTRHRPENSFQPRQAWPASVVGPLPTVVGASPTQSVCERRRRNARIRTPMVRALSGFPTGCNGSREPTKQSDSNLTITLRAGHLGGVARTQLRRRRRDRHSRASYTRLRPRPPTGHNRLVRKDSGGKISVDQRQGPWPPREGTSWTATVSTNGKGAVRDGTTAQGRAARRSLPRLRHRVSKIAGNSGWQHLPTATYTVSGTDGHCGHMAWLRRGKACDEALMTLDGSVISLRSYARHHVRHRRGRRSPLKDLEWEHAGEPTRSSL